MAALDLHPRSQLPAGLAGGKPAVVAVFELEMAVVIHTDVDGLGQVHGPGPGHALCVKQRLRVFQVAVVADIDLGGAHGNHLATNHAKGHGVQVIHIHGLELGARVGAGRRGWRLWSHDAIVARMGKAGHRQPYSSCREPVMGSRRSGLAGPTASVV